jgi:hypothetical protein
VIPGIPGRSLTPPVAQVRGRSPRRASAWTVADALGRIDSGVSSVVQPVRRSRVVLGQPSESDLGRIVHPSGGVSLREPRQPNSGGSR